MRRFALALLTTTGLVGFASVASAADLGPRMTTKAPVVAPVPYFSWTGIYIGGHVGWGWGSKDWTTIPAPGVASHDTDGFIGGGQIGFNYQTGQLVLGLEADASWSDMKGTGLCANPAFTCGTDVNWLSTVTGRLGWAAWDRGLLYVKGGVAFADNDFHVRSSLLGVPGASASETKVGWTVGAGLEYAFAPSWSAKVEYNYVDLGTDRVTFTDGTLIDMDQTAHLLKFGINYRFGWGAPLAPY